MPADIITTDGPCVSYGTINRGKNDGLEFVFISSLANPNKPLVAIPKAYAIMIIKQIASALLATLDATTNEYTAFTQQKLLNVSDCIDEIVDASDD
jgi:hypothetical protein